MENKTSLLTTGFFVSLILISCFLSQISVEKILYFDDITYPSQVKGNKFVTILPLNESEFIAVFNKKDLVNSYIPDFLRSAKLTLDGLNFTNYLKHPPMYTSSWMKLTKVNDQIRLHLNEGNQIKVLDFQKEEFAFNGEVYDYFKNSYLGNTDNDENYFYIKSKDLYIYNVEKKITRKIAGIPFHVSNFNAAELSIPEEVKSSILFSYVLEGRLKINIIDSHSTEKGEQMYAKDGYKKAGNIFKCKSGTYITAITKNNTIDFFRLENRKIVRAISLPYLSAEKMTESFCKNNKIFVSGVLENGHVIFSKSSEFFGKSIFQKLFFD